MSISLGEKCPPKRHSKVMKARRTEEEEFYEKQNDRSMEDPMSSSLILHEKHAVVFGAGGSIGLRLRRSSRPKARRSFLPAARARMWKT